MSSLYKCSKCGKENFSTSYCKSELIKMENRKMCFGCSYWYDRYLNRDNINQIVVNGEMYQVGPENQPKSRFRGFGGRKFKIKRLLTGEEFETTNLWYNGEIPECFKQDFKNNAEFIPIK
jgi:hypothetical protein